MIGSCGCEWTAFFVEVLDIGGLEVVNVASIAGYVLLVKVARVDTNGD